MVAITEVFGRLAAPLKRRVLLMIGRAVVTLIDDARRMQTLQLVALAGETIDGAERFQQYGLSAHPQPGAEALLLTPGGIRQHPIVAAVDDRRYRPRGLAQGEVCLYTDEDGEQTHRIHLARGREIRLIAGASSIVLRPDGITLTAPRIDLEQA